MREALVIQLVYIALLLGASLCTAVLLVACTESRVYISVGEEARAGRTQEVDSIIETEIDADITGIKK